MYRVARRMTLDPAEAEDLVSQTLLLAARSWESFDGRHPRSWLLKILKNEGYKASRNRHGNADSLEGHDELVDGDTEQRIGDKLTVEAIYDCLDRIPLEYRLAVTLCDGEELTYDEAATVLDVPTGTIRSRLYRGRKMLQQKLQRWSE